MLRVQYIRGMKWWITIIALIWLLAGCGIGPEPHLKVLGEKVVERKTVQGQVINDTVTAYIPAFSFTDQNGNTVDTSTINDKIYVVDFFFTHCPSICPKMKAEMHKVYEKYKDRKDILILSHSIDPVRDSVPVLKMYSAKLNIDDSKWYFLTGDKDSIYAIAENYLSYTKEDNGAPGGFIHDGNFILIDRKRRIRGYYDGTTDDGAEKLIKDIDLLIHEK